MLRTLTKFKGGSPEFQGWLFQIARKQVNAYTRRKPSRSADNPVGNWPKASPSRTGAAELDPHGLVDALKNLSEEQQDVFLIRFVAGLPLAQTASMLHTSENSVIDLQRSALEVMRGQVATREVVYETGRKTSNLPAAD